MQTKQNKTTTKQPNPTPPQQKHIHKLYITTSSSSTDSSVYSWMVFLLDPLGLNTLLFGGIMYQLMFLFVPIFLHVLFRIMQSKVKKDTVLELDLWSNVKISESNTHNPQAMIDSFLSNKQVRLIISILYFKSSLLLI